MSTVNEEIETAKTLQAEKKFNQVLAKIAELSGLKLNKKQNFEILLLSGIAKMNVSRYDEAKEDFKDALKLAEKSEDLWQQTRALHQLGIITKLLGNYPQAIELFREELRRCSSLIPSYYSDLSYNFYEQGDVMMLSGNYEDAEMYFQHAYTFADTEHNHHGVALAMEALGNLYSFLGRKEKVKACYEKSLENFKLAKAEEEVAAVQAILDRLNAEE